MGVTNYLPTAMILQGGHHPWSPSNQVVPKMFQNYPPEDICKGMIIHPGNLTWNPKMKVWKMFFLFKWVIFRFHVSFRGCTSIFWAQDLCETTHPWLSPACSSLGSVSSAGGGSPGLNKLMSKNPGWLFCKGDEILLMAEILHRDV